jgi:hypothetical protein
MRWKLAVWLSEAYSVIIWWLSEVETTIIEFIRKFARL